MNRILTFLSNTYLLVMVTALLIGVFVPAAQHLSGWNTLFLQVIFFLSAIKLDHKQVTANIKDWKLILLATGTKMAVLPLVVWSLTLFLPTELSLSLFLLAAVPVGMTTPLLIELMGGRPALAIILTIATSLLAPFSIPWLTKVLYGESISIDALEMFFRLVIVIFVPLGLAVIFRRLFPKINHTMSVGTKPVSQLLLGLLIAGAVASQSDQLLSGGTELWKMIAVVVGLTLFFGLSHLIGYMVGWWESSERRNIVSISLTYMNFSLAIYLADQFFPRPEVLLPLVLAIIPWATLLPLWESIVNRYLAESQKSSTSRSKKQGKK